MSLADGHENDAVFTLFMEDGSTIEMSGRTALLCTFAGRNCIYDHVYVDTDPDEEMSEAHYIFRGNPCFDMLQHIVLTHGFPHILDAPEVPEHDRLAFEEMQMAAIEANFGDLAG